PPPRAYPLAPEPTTARRRGVTIRPMRIATRRGHAGNCPYCRAAVLEAEGERAAVCSACKARYHAECLEELGRCATYGCGSVTADVVARGGGAARSRPRTTGPRVGAPRFCDACDARFTVTESNRYSAFCAPCARKRLWKGIGIFLVCAVLYLFLNGGWVL